MTNTMRELFCIMREQGYNQETFCNKYGYCKSTVSRWANDSRKPSIESIEKMADDLGYEIVLVEKRRRHDRV